MIIKSSGMNITLIMMIRIIMPSSIIILISLKWYWRIITRQEHHNNRDNHLRSDYNPTSDRNNDWLMVWLIDWYTTFMPSSYSISFVKPILSSSRASVLATSRRCSSASSWTRRPGATSSWQTRSALKIKGIFGSAYKIWVFLELHSSYLSFAPRWDENVVFSLGICKKKPFILWILYKSSVHVVSSKYKIPIRLWFAILNSNNAPLHNGPAIK